MRLAVQFVCSEHRRLCVWYVNKATEIVIMRTGAWIITLIMVVYGDTNDANIVCKLCQRNQWIKKEIVVIFALFDGNVYIWEKKTQTPQALLPMNW